MKKFFRTYLPIAIVVFAMIFGAGLLFSGCGKVNKQPGNSPKKYNINLFYTNNVEPDRSFEYDEGTIVEFDTDKNSPFLTYVRGKLKDKNNDIYNVFAGWYDNPLFQGERIYSVTVDHEINLYAKIISTYKALFEYYKIAGFVGNGDKKVHYNSITNNVYIDDIHSEDGFKLIFQTTLDGASTSFKLYSTQPFFDQVHGVVVPAGTLYQIGEIMYKPLLKYNANNFSISVTTSDVVAAITYNPYNLADIIARSLFGNAFRSMTSVIPTVGDFESMTGYYV